MFDEEDRPKPVTAKPDLDPMGVEELQDYIAELTAEIARAEAEIARKQSHRGAADALFGKPG